MSEASAATAPSAWRAGLPIGLAYFSLIFGYELLRSASNTLFNQHVGVSRMPLASAVVPPFLLVALYGYARILSWGGPARTLLLTTLGSMLMALAAFGAVAGANSFAPWVPAAAATALYVFREIYVMVLVEQYWSFLNSSLDAKGAARLGGPVVGLGSFGSVVAGLLGSRFVGTIGTENLLLVVAGSFAPAAFFGALAFRLTGEARPSRVEEGGRRGQMGFGELRRHRMLVLLFAVVALSQAVSAFSTLQFQSRLQDALPVPDEQTAYSLGFYAKMNMVSMACQFLVAPLLLGRVSAGLVFFLIPLVHLAIAAVSIGSPGLFWASISLVAFKALDYSLFRVTKEVSYVGLSFDTRYRAKQLIDAFGNRFAKGVASGGVALVQGAIGLSAVFYPAAIAAAAGVWAAAAVAFVRERKV